VNFCKAENKHKKKPQNPFNLLDSTCDIKLWFCVTSTQTDLTIKEKIDFRINIAQHCTLKT